MKNIHTYGALFALSLVMQSTPVQADLNNSIYVPVEPCRVGNTVPTKVTAGNFIEWLAYGDDLSSQGGAGSPGCPQPKAGMKPIGVALNVTVVGNQATGNGNVVAYPADGATPSGSLVNYKPGTNIANSTIVGLCQDGVCDGKFRLLSNISDVPLIADVQGYFYPAPGKIAHVAKTGGDYTSPWDALSEVLSWCGHPSPTNRCLVKIAPGTYDLGSKQMRMRSYVRIQGSGQDATIITGGVGAADAVSTASLVTGSDHATLMDLTIENTGTFSKYSFAIYNDGASPRIERVTVTVTGAFINYGVYNSSSSSPVMTDVTTSATGGVTNNGVRNDSSSPVMMNVSASASGGTESFGVWNDSSSPVMMNVSASANIVVGGKASGIYNNASNPVMINVTASASAGSSGYGMQIVGSSPYIQDSVIEGNTKGLKMDSSSSLTRVVNSKIIGGVIDDPSGTTNCRGNYDENLADVNC